MQFWTVKIHLRSRNVLFTLKTTFFITQNFNLLIKKMVNFRPKYLFLRENFIFPNFGAKNDFFTENAQFSKSKIQFRDQKCANQVRNSENGEWPDTREALEAHYEAFGRDWSQVQIENIKGLIEKYGIAKLKNILDNEAKWNSTSDGNDLTDSSDISSNVEIPAFAQERFQWNSLGWV